MAVASWLVFALLSYASYAISSTIDKYNMNYGMQPLPTNMVKMFFDGAVILILAFLFFDVSFSRAALKYAAVLGGLYAVSGVFYFKALQVKDVKAVIPTQQSMTILLTFLAAVFLLGEAVTAVNYVGVAAVVAGVYLVLSRDGFALPEWDTGTGFIAVNIVIGVIYTVLVKVWVAAVEPVVLATTMYFATAFLLFLYIAVVSDVSTYHAVTPSRDMAKIIVAAVFGGLGTFFLYTALSVGNASKVYPVAGLQAALIFLFATVLLNEEFTWHRCLGVAAVAVGIGLVSL